MYCERKVMENTVENNEKPPDFKEILLSGVEPAWCVDGRCDNTIENGPQMLGGSLHSVVLSAIATNSVFDQEYVDKNLLELHQNGFRLGVHRGSHKHPEDGTCDCGFADKLPAIIQKAKDQRVEITRRLMDVYRENGEAIGLSESEFSQVIENAYKSIEEFDLENIQVKGEKLVSIGEGNGAVAENLEGDHGETVCFVNLKENTTLDTIGMNEQGTQAFNLDLWMAMKQSESLGVSKDLAMGGSLILYQATEMVLVEDNGKTALPVVVRS